MEENKKSKKGIIITIIFVLIILGLVGYILVDKGIIDIGPKEEISIPIEKRSANKEIKLDVNYRLVQSLYNKVTTGSEFCGKNWIYGNRNGSNDYKEEFDIKTASEQEKMNFVGNLLEESKQQYVDCNTANIPDEMQPKDKEWKHHSICALNKIDAGVTELESAYSKEYIDMLYKSIFGKNSKLDTTASISTDQYGIRTYYYISDLDKYVLYGMNGGGTCGPLKYKDTLEKATLKGKVLKIYEKEVVETGDNEVRDESGKIIRHDKAGTNTYKYVYTFERESDGMYKFISRKKEK